MGLGGCFANASPTLIRLDLPHGGVQGTHLPYPPPGGRGSKTEKKTPDGGRSWGMAWMGICIAVIGNKLDGLDITCSLARGSLNRVAVLLRIVL